MFPLLFFKGKCARWLMKAEELSFVCSSSSDKTSSLMLQCNNMFLKSWTFHLPLSDCYCKKWIYVWHLPSQLLCAWVHKQSSCAQVTYIIFGRENDFAWWTPQLESININWDNPSLVDTIESIMCHPQLCDHLPILIQIENELGTLLVMSFQKVHGHSVVSRTQREENCCSAQLAQHVLRK